MSVIMNYQIIGMNIRECRLEANLTQEALAELAGIGQQFLSKLERGKGIPSLATVMSLCDALHVNTERLLSRCAAHDFNPPCRLRSDGKPFGHSLSDDLFPQNPEQMITIDPEDLPLLDMELPEDGSED